MQKYIYTIYNTNTYTQYTSTYTCIHTYRKKKKKTCLE